MGEETASRTPFLFFTDHGPELAEAVREGRRNEFARFADFADPAKRERIPDPNAPVHVPGFGAACPIRSTAGPAMALYRKLIALRLREIVPRLDGAAASGRGHRAEGGGGRRSLARSGTARADAPSARRGMLVDARRTLTIATNLDAAPVPFDPPPGRLLFANTALPPGTLPGHCTAAFLDPSESHP